MMLLSHIEAWVVELERVVNAFEDAVDEVEEALDEAEQASEYDDAQVRRNWDLRQLENALESALRVAGLVRAANTALDEAIDAARLVVINERLETSTANGDALAQQLQTAPRNTELRHSEAIPGSLAGSLDPLPEGSIVMQGKYRLVQLLHRRPRLHLYLAQRLTDGSPSFRGTAGDHKGPPRHSSPPSPLREEGTAGDHKGPPYHSSPPSPTCWINPHSTEGYFPHTDAAPTDQSLVAIRELVLTGLSPELRRQIERAAFEEFASPPVLGSPHLPGAGDRVCSENERHYLVMQLRPARGQRATIAVTLAGLLLQQSRWPSWLDIGATVEGVRRLSRVVARLHRMGVILGDLNPGTVLVDAERAAEWAPVMLISWPPPSKFWPTSDPSNRALPGQVFPIAESSPGDAFAAPETLNGMYDERSDVYSLGAILYLLLTRYTPAPASLRLNAESSTPDGRATIKAHPATLHLPRPYGNGIPPEGGTVSSGPLHDAEGIGLLPPHLFNYRISAELEQVVMRALSLDAADRYPSVYALLEALESIDLEKSRAEIVSTKENTQREPKATKVVEWLKRELIE